MAVTSFSSSVSGLSQVSQLAEQFMQEQFAWGQQQFAQNSVLTDQVVGDLMHLYGSLSGLGDTLMNSYSKYFIPEYQQLVNDANNYASTARVQQAMGAAESGVSQSFNAQRNAALADLQSFGIDPSSGRYAQLDAAERTQQAAAMAGAGFQAQQATEATGRALRSEALQLGSVMPSQATAAYNAAQGAATAGVNAKLANSQEGLNMMGSPAQLGSVAQQYRTSTSGPGGGGQVNPSKGERPTPPMRSPGNMNPAPQRDTGAGDRTASPKQMQAPRAGALNPSPNVIPGQGGSDQGLDWSSGDYPDANNYGGGYPTGEVPYNSGDAFNQYQNFGIDASDDDDVAPPVGDTTGSVDQFDASDYNNYDTSGGDYSSYYNNDTGGGGDTSYNTTSDTGGGGGGDVNYNDYYDSQSSGYDASEDYAKGGAIPYHKSPSRGRVTDDIPGKVNQTGENIRVNAGEFIIPRHTVQWKGEKYFKDLIEKSKQQRATHAHRGPTLRPALAGAR